MLSFLINFYMIKKPNNALQILFSGVCDLEYYYHFAMFNVYLRRKLGWPQSPLTYFVFNSCSKNKGEAKIELKIKIGVCLNHPEYTLPWNYSNGYLLQ